MLNHGRIAALENTRDLLKEYSKDRVVFTLSRLLLSWLYRFPSPPALNRAYAARREEFLELRDCHN